MSYPRASHAWPERRDDAAPIGRLLIWGVGQCGLFFMEMLSELLAPLLLLGGIAWSVVLKIAGGIHLDHPEVQSVVEHLPATVGMGGHVLTPGGLIADGLLLILVAAICRTLSGLLARL